MNNSIKNRKYLFPIKQTNVSAGVEKLILIHHSEKP